MKAGGMMTTAIMLVGIVIFGIGLYAVSSKDEDIIDRVVEEMRTLRKDVESEKKMAERFRTDILLTANKIDEFLNQQTSDPKIPEYPHKLDVSSKEAMTVKFDRPIQVEIIDKRTRVQQTPPPLPKIKKHGGTSVRKK